MSDELFRGLAVRKKSALLLRMMQELAGEALMSLEGDLSACAFPDSLIVPEGTPGAPGRSTLFPRMNFVVLRLSKEAVEPTFAQILKAGLKHAIMHLAITRVGRVQFAAHDHFHPDCVVAGRGVPLALLADLKSSGLISSFDPLPDDLVNT